MKRHLWVVALLAMALHAAAKTNFYPIRITSELGIRSVGDIPAKLKQPGQYFIATLWNEKDKEHIYRDIQTGEDYERALADGYYAFANTPYEAAMASFYIQAVEPLFYLRMVKPSKISYVRSIKFNRLSPCELPADIIFLRQRGSREERVEKNPKTYVITKRTSTRLEWVDVPALDYSGAEPVEAYQYSNVLIYMASGDFNNDGIEDLLCYFMQTILNAHSTEHSVVVLTRYRPGGLIYTIPDLDKPMLEDLRKRKTAGK